MKKSILAALGAGALAISAVALVTNPRGAAATAPATLPQPAATEAGSVAVTLRVAPQGNSARYLVQEQLVGFDLPNEAIGVTRNVSGAIALDSAGRIVPAASRIEVGVGSLTSDKERRDGYVRARILEAEQYPSVVFAPTGVQGLSFPLPASGTRTFALSGNLTIRNVTRPVTWNITANFGDGTIEGVGATRFAFADFNLTQPRVPVVLSVADTIKLEYNFTLAR